MVAYHRPRGSLVTRPFACRARASRGVTSAGAARAPRGGVAFVDRELDAALQRLIVRVEAQGLDGGLGVRRRSTGDQLEQGGERLLISRCREREDDGVPDIGPFLTGQAPAERD